MKWWSESDSASVLGACWWLSVAVGTQTAVSSRNSFRLAGCSAMPLTLAVNTLACLYFVHITTIAGASPAAHCQVPPTQLRPGCAPHNLQFTLCDLDPIPAHSHEHLLLLLATSFSFSSSFRREALNSISSSLLRCQLSSTVNLIAACSCSAKLDRR